MTTGATTSSSVVWAPQDGSQKMFMSCPIHECLYEGTRGPGKTDALIMSFCQHVGKGYGQHWRGLIIRELFKNLEDVIAKSHKWIPNIWPGAKFTGGNKPKWRFPDGEVLFFVHGNKLTDYNNYHGHEYPFIGWEELTNHASPALYLKMMSVNRSTGPKEMPRFVRATTNPGGIGHNWVKKRFIDPAKPGEIISERVLDPLTNKYVDRKRVRIFGHWSENKFLLENDPEYLIKLMDNPEHLVKAWIYGSWDIVAGGMFDDVWRADYNVVPPFTIPGTWRIDRGFDWGSGHPFSVLWFAESDGCDIRWQDGTEMSTRKGDVFVIAEWYGADKRDETKGLKMTAKEIASGIIEREKEWGLKDVKPGPADSEIWNVKGKTTTLAEDMEEVGVYFVKADKGPGSRVTGWDKMRRAIKAAWCDDEDGAGLFVFDTCRNFISHVPVLPRDEIKLEDVDTDALDHDADCARYRLTTQRTSLEMTTTKGTY